MPGGDPETIPPVARSSEKQNESAKGTSKKKRKKWSKKPPVKITKDERRAKYTKLARDRREKNMSDKRGKGLVCFRCRKRGHAASDCKADMEADGGSRGHAGGEGSGSAKICFKCGSTEHGLTGCPQMRKAPKMPSGRIDYSKIELPHAKCFVCGEMGHLASRCEKNEGKGIFVLGGSCRVCGSKQHIAADCPEKKKEKEDPGDKSEEDDGDVDDLLEDEDTRVSGSMKKKKKDESEKSESVGKSEKKKKKRKIVKF